MELFWIFWYRLKGCFHDWTADDTRLLIIGAIAFVSIVALALQAHAWAS